MTAADAEGKRRFIEAAGRRLCELRGIDPDESIPHGQRVPRGNYRGGPVNDMLYYSKAWELAGEECVNWLHLAESIQSATMGFLKEPQ